VINASMMSEAEIQHHLEQFHAIDSSISIKACHNFYVREESGLDSEFALTQSSYFKKQGIPVYYCAPSYDHPRGPLHLGLPTLEHHRYQPLDFVLLELIHHFQADGILYSDEWMSENQFKIRGILYRLCAYGLFQNAAEIVLIHFFMKRIFPNLPLHASFWRRLLT
jgi:hypothetical protein